jgi:hypothetical protein
MFKQETSSQHVAAAAEASKPTRKRKTEEDDQYSVEGARKNARSTERERKRKKCMQEGCKKLARQDQMCHKHDEEHYIREYLRNHPQLYKGYLKLRIFKRPDYKASTNKNVVAKAAKEEAEQNIGPFLDQVEETKRWYVFPDSFAVK